jgi:hypothetical protein
VQLELEVASLRVQANDEQLKGLEAGIGPRANYDALARELAQLVAAEKAVAAEHVELQQRFILYAASPPNVAELSLGKEPK